MFFLLYEQKLKQTENKQKIKGLWGRLTDEIELKWEWLCCDIL